MTAIDTPTFIQSGGETAEETRRSLGAILGLRGGIIGATDMAVSQASTPNMSVDVAGGQVVIPGTEATYQGYYICENRGTQNVALAAANPTNGRKDLIVARIRDAGYSGAVNSFAIEAVTGTPAGSPADPTVPANCWVLARVNVSPSDSAISNADIDDLRTGATGYTSQNGFAVARGGIVPCTSTNRPTQGLYEGLVAYETDTDRLIINLSSGTSWNEFARVGTLPGFTPVLSQSVTLSKTTNYSGVTRLGRTVIWTWSFTITSAGTANQAFLMTLPYTSADQDSVQGSFVYFDSGNTNFQGGITPFNSNTVSFVIDGNNNNFGSVAGNPTAASGDVIRGLIVFEAST